MKLILVRHGETIENKKGISQGHMPGRLSEEGKRQAQKLSKRLKKERFDCIYSSDLARALDTAKSISQYHKNVPIFLTQDLREGDLKNWTGRKIVSDPKEIARLRKIYGRIESKASMRKRAKKVLDEAYAKYSRGCVLFVGHGQINRALICVILGKPASLQNMRKIGQHNTAVNIFEIREDGKHKIHLLNCKKHLE